MNTIKNAISALKRNSGRNIFISLIMLVIISISCIALIINNTAGNIAKEQKEKFGSKVFIQMSEEAMNNMMQNSSVQGSAMSFGGEPLAPSLLQEIAKSKYLKDTIFDSGFGADSPQLKPAKNEGGQNGMMGSSSVTIGGSGEQMKAPDFQIQGYSANQKESVLSNANRKLVDGKLPTSPLEVMISSGLAKENDVKVGDTFTLDPMVYDDKQPAPSSMEVSVSGIYSDLPSTNSEMFMFDQGNQIYMLYGATLDEAYGTQAYLNATYYLNSPDDLDAFADEARSLGLSDQYEVTTDETTYQQVVGPIDSMSSMSLLFLGVVLVLGAAILVLLTILNIRERNYEIGILRSLGMKKHKVIFQMIMEPAILMAMMLVIGCGLGSVIAQPISDTLLSQQVEAANQPQNGGSFMIMSTSVGGSSEETIREMNVSLDATTLFQLFGVASILVILSGLISSVYIVKYEPMQILSERR